MKLDRFDRILIVLAAMAATALLGFIFKAIPDRTTRIDSRTMERELSDQARQGLIDRLYAPVVAAMQAGKLQEALLKLEEINVRYPGEAHGFILKGEIYEKLGISVKAAASLVQGVKLNGDYIDKRSPVSRRDLVLRLVEQELPKATASYRAGAGSSVIKENLADLNYLKSRLAGGCE